MNYQSLDIFYIESLAKEENVIQKLNDFNIEPIKKPENIIQANNNNESIKRKEFPKKKVSNNINPEDNLNINQYQTNLNSNKSNSNININNNINDNNNLNNVIYSGNSSNDNIKKQKKYN